MSLQTYTVPIRITCVIKKGGFLLLLLGVLSTALLSATTFTVTNTNDSGAGSLRSAIVSVNGGVGGDTIAFNIPGTGPFTIQPLTDLPAIIKPLTTINGYTQPGTRVTTIPASTDAVLLIEINGSNYTVGDGNITGNGLVLGAGSGGSTVKGLVINQWISNGILIDGSPGSKVLGNFIGTNVDGSSQLANRTGIRTVNSPGTIIGTINSPDRNLIAGSFEYIIKGACIRVESDNTLIKGNLIGVDSTGESALGNSIEGVSLSLVARCQVGGREFFAQNLISGHSGFGIHGEGISDCLIQNNYIGTDVNGNFAIGNTTAGIGLDATGGSSLNNVIRTNLISGNGVGIKLGDSTPTGFVTQFNAVESNFIGTNSIGLSSIGNLYAGVWVLDSNNTIGGAYFPQHNIISGNGENGVLISDFATHTKVIGNFIGVDISGNKPLGNGLYGIQVGLDPASLQVNSTMIGGAGSGEGNVISANGKDGILIHAFTTGTTVEGNFIGTNAVGNDPLPNGCAGIEIICSSSNFIGGTIPAAGNLIAYNPYGILIGSCRVTCETHDNVILTNSIFASGKKGLVLVKEANDHLSAPKITDIEICSDATRVKGKLKSTPNSNFLIQFFSTPCLGVGEGKRFLGELVVTTNASGKVGFSATSSPSDSGEYITATATILGINDSPLETSQFSKPVKTN